MSTEAQLKFIETELKAIRKTLDKQEILMKELAKKEQDDHTRVLLMLERIKAISGSQDSSCGEFLKTALGVTAVAGITEKLQRIEKGLETISDYVKRNR